MNDFQSCEICGETSWQEVYRGNIRDGAVGRFKEHGLVAQCGGCGVQRLAERLTIPDSFYIHDQYRASLQQSVDTETAFIEQDWLTHYTHQAIWPRSIRGIAIADIGCGVGSFLDTCQGLAQTIIAVDPCQPFHASLQARGYKVYGTVSDIDCSLLGTVDLATSIQVIEHVSDPVGFLRGIRPILKPEAELLITTPNRNDILMNLIPDVFSKFFYRSAHRWYFDAESLARCSRLAGYRVIANKTMHKYGMSNMLQWLRDGKPKGFASLAGIGPVADSFWKGYLEQTGQADMLCMRLVPDTSRPPCESEK